MSQETALYLAPRTERFKPVTVWAQRVGEHFRHITGGERGGQLMCANVSLLPYSHVYERFCLRAVPLAVEIPCLNSCFACVEIVWHVVIQDVMFFLDMSPST